MLQLLSFDSWHFTHLEQDPNQYQVRIWFSYYKGAWTGVDWKCPTVICLIRAPGALVRPDIRVCRESLQWTGRLVIVLTQQKWPATWHIVKSVHEQLLSIECPLPYACRVLIVCGNYCVIRKSFRREIGVNDWLKGASKQDCTHLAKLEFYL